MKKLRYLYIGTLLAFVLLLVVANVLQKNKEDKSYSQRNIFMNRFADMVEDEFAHSEEEPEFIIKTCFNHKLELWQKEYDKSDLPVDITFIGINHQKASVNNMTDSENSQCLWAIYDEEQLTGFLVFSYEDESYQQKAMIMNACIIAAFLLIVIIIFYIHHRILAPFLKMSEYPERLSKGSFTDKLPETRNRYFGKFVWGVNMLGDKISYDKKHINRLVEERQTLLATIAHGIKTPIANIKLYATAVETGLYQQDGIPNEKDAEIAVKINNNADEISKLVQEMIQSSMEGLVDFVPNPESFYSTEIKEYIEEEFTNRLDVLKIPYTIECVNKTLVASDKNGILRIMSQLLENAIKYGDGTGIYIQIEKQEEGHYFTIRNNGKPVSDTEIPYIFNSFWRGSNAESVEGSGIGLYEAKQIAKRLSGDLFSRGSQDKDGMEFILYIP